MKNFILNNWKLAALTLLGALFFLNLTPVEAQTPYEVSVETVVYSDVTGREMDIYTPITDDATPRPMILFAHGGSFVGGSKNTQTAEYFCQTFAEKGYVTGSFNYTLAANIAILADSLQMIDIVLKAMGDGKAAVRYMRKEAEKYKVDTDQIFLGGNSAGAILSLHAGMFSDLSEVPEYFVSMVEATGGIDGNAGNDGFSSDIKGIISLAGGLNMTSFLDADDPAFVSCHGDADGIVPYLCDDVYSGDDTFGIFDLVDICGSGAIHPIADELGIPNALKIYPDADHTPWSVELTNGKPAMMNEVIDFVSDFLSEQLTDIGVLTNVEDITATVDFKVFPNPTTNGLQVQINDPSILIEQIQLFDATGRLLSAATPNSNDFYLDRKNIAPGFYQLHIISNEGAINTKVIFE